MKKARITFEMLSYWHMGSGTGEGANVDAVVVKDAAGLPYIPGRTVKGVLREAVLCAEELNLVPAGTTERLFGTRSQTANRFETKPGALRFSNATLGGEMAAWAAEPMNAGTVAGLYRQVSSTCIDERGMAKDDTLRRIEVAVPVALQAQVTGPTDHGDWLTALAASAPFIRGGGAHRHRGLGRVAVNIKEVQE